MLSSYDMMLSYGFCKVLVIDELIVVHLRLFGIIQVSSWMIPGSSKCFKVVNGVHMTHP